MRPKVGCEGRSLGGLLEVLLLEPRAPLTPDAIANGDAAFDALVVLRHLQTADRQKVLFLVLLGAIALSAETGVVLRCKVVAEVGVGLVKQKNRSSLMSCVEKRADHLSAHAAKVIGGHLLVGPLPVPVLQAPLELLLEELFDVVIRGHHVTFWR